MWVCQCGVTVESRTKYLMHKGIGKTEDVSLEKCDLQERSFQDNLQESACALPIFEEPFCDLIPNIEQDYTACSEITITNNVNSAQMTGLLSPIAEPIAENLITCSQGDDFLPVVDEIRSDVNISLEREFILNNTVTISNENGEQHTDHPSSFVENPTKDRPTEYNELISETLTDIHQVR